MTTYEERLRAGVSEADATSHRHLLDAVLPIVSALDELQRHLSSPIKNIPRVPYWARPSGPTADLQRQLDRIEAKLDELLRRLVDRSAQ